MGRLPVAFAMSYPPTIVRDPRRGCQGGGSRPASHADLRRSTRGFGVPVDDGYEANGRLVTDRLRCGLASVRVTLAERRLDTMVVRMIYGAANNGPAYGLMTIELFCGVRDGEPVGSRRGLRRLRDNWIMSGGRSVRHSMLTSDARRRVSDSPGRGRPPRRRGAHRSRSSLTHGRWFRLVQPVTIWSRWEGAGVSRTRVRLVHSHNGKAAQSQGSRRSGLAGPRTVNTFHGHVLDGYLARGGKVSCRRALLAKKDRRLIAISPRSETPCSTSVSVEVSVTCVPLGLDLECYFSQGPEWAASARP